MHDAELRHKGKMMAYKEEQNIVFVRVPMSEAEEKKIDQAVAESGLKKYEWVRRALLSKAENAGSGGDQ